MFLRLIFAAALLLPLAGQQAGRDLKKLPDGRSRAEAVLQADYEDSRRDAGRLLELAEELKAEIEKNETNVLSVKSVRKAEEIEELAKKIQKRLKRY